MYLPEHLDILTLIFLCGVVSTLFAVVMGGVSWRLRPFESLGWLALADALLALAMVVRWPSASGVAPWCITVASLLVVAGFALNLEACRRLSPLIHWHKLWPHWSVLLAMLTILPTLWLLHGANDDGMTAFALVGFVVFVVVKNVSFLYGTVRSVIDEQAEKARTDALTGLLNRRAALTQGSIELERARRQSQPLSVLLLDIDHFKAINEGYGHKTGDAVLVHMGNLLTRQTRKFDLCARYGGEEFLIILPGTPLSTAVSVAEKLRTALAAEGWDEIDGRRTTASFGVSAFAGHDSLEELIASADRALRDAKHNGRNRVESVAI